MFERIDFAKPWIHIKKLDEGWSDDDKYQITDSHNHCYLLRISPVNLYENRKKQFELLKILSKKI